MTETDLYFMWLCSKVDIPSRMPYLSLASALHNCYFTPDRTGMDMNRAYDGLHLRAEYMEKHGSHGSSGSRGACTMLEMLIGLAKRMAFLMENEEKPKRISEFFWKLIQNLGRSGFDDIRFRTLHGESAVPKAVKHVLDRDYMPDGRGGLFPVKHASSDFRKMEIWYQMHAWLNENYWSEIL